MRAALLAVPLLIVLPVAASAQAPGSYRQSCTNIEQNGPVLTARCRGSNGRLNDTSLNVDQCGGNGVANAFGRLVCGNVKGTSRPVGGGFDAGGDDRAPQGYDRPPRRRVDPYADDSRSYDDPRPRRPRYQPDPPAADDSYPVAPRRRYAPDPYQ